MIEVFGYKAYHGDMLIQTGEDKRLLTNRDFLYNPKEHCWFDSTDSKYPEEIVLSVLPYYNIERCGETVETYNEDCDTVCQCVFDITEHHEGVIVEVLTCPSCGRKEIEWYRDPTVLNTNNTVT